ncbi:uncharacterized protein LOC119076219 [Bradysia coprophila]|uniref:uncharacterized protein LOC119076219 n=1 Tax=Bradysia coprophila TaxID=38358 RepID=UPI00187D8065|nr:uncharacterized protein LOC119076219 [Bradysia coprophila]
MKPSKKKPVKLRRSKRSTDLLKSVLQKSVYEKLPIGRKYRNSVLTNCKGDKMSAHFMRLANSITVRLDSYCKKYTSVHGKSNSRLSDAIERINGMLDAEGFEGSAVDDFDSWIQLKEDDISRSDHDRITGEIAEETDTGGATSMMEQQESSPLECDKSEVSEDPKVTNDSVEPVDDLVPWEIKLKADLTSFVDYTWRYKATEEITIKEIIMNLLENGVDDDESVSNASDGTDYSTMGLEDSPIGAQHSE